MSISRRQMLAGGAAALGLPGLAARADAQAASPKRVLRLAHITDCHIQRGPGEAGLAHCLHHLQAQADKPALILNTGDTVMDSFGRDEAATAAQWSVWQTLIRAECSLPIESAIGNHDVWGGNKTASRTTGTEPRWGKQWAVEALGIGQRYRSFDRAGWHFVVLDSTFVTGGGYLAKLDEEQFAWLGDDLAKVPAATPIAVMSHEPILAACAYFDGHNEKEDQGVWQVPGSWMHIDARRIKDLFYKHRNVRLALSGHMHLCDRVDYLGVTYCCDGAVSGNWWNAAQPNYHECPPGYALIDLFDDGSNRVEYVPHGYRQA